MEYGQYIGDAMMLLAGGAIGWLTNYKKQKADIKQVEVSTKQTEVDVLDKALAAINEKVVAPLTARLELLQDDYETVLKELKQLRNAISKMYVCRHVADCPIKLELQKQQANTNRAKNRKPSTNRQREPSDEDDGETSDGTAIDGPDEDTPGRIV